MANWWDDAPLAKDSQPATNNQPAASNWWDTAPLVQPPKDLKRVYIGGKEPTGLERAADTAKGLYKALDAGTAAGLAGLGGMLGDLTDLGARGIEGASNAVSDFTGMPRYERPSAPSAFDKIPRSKDVQQFIQDTYYGGEKPYEPQGTAEEVAKTVGEFLPNALGGGGGIARRIAAGVVAPAIGSEVAGRGAKLIDPKLEPLGRFLGAITGGGAGAYLNKPGITRSVLESQLPPGITAQHIDQAYALMQDAAQRGIATSWPEAISQVAGRPVLTDLLRHLEASPKSAAQMGEFFAPRPQQVRQAVQTEAENISPGVMPDRSTIGPAVGQAAEAELEGVRRGINRQADPFYGRDANVLLDPQQMARVEALPGYAEARDAVRGNTQLNRRVAHLPDNSVGFLNQVKKELDRTSIHADSPLRTQGRNVEEASGLASDANAVRTNASLASMQRGTSSYPIALQIEEQGRQRILQPLLDGPLGKLAGRDTATKQAIETLFPRGAQEYSPAEISHAVGAVASRSPRAATDLVRAYVQRVFDQTAKDLQSGPNQAGGAKFRAVIAGSPEQRANLQAAMEALPNGADRWRGMNRLLDVMEATGTRQNIGSRTAYNQEFKDAMETAGGIPSTIVKATGDPLKALKPLSDKLIEWRNGRNMHQLASVITDPQSYGMLRQLAGTPRSATGRPTWRDTNIALHLINYANASRTKD